jgi:hypothetical protein
MTDKWYVYVNCETLLVYKISPALEIDEASHIVEIDKALGITFIDSPHLINNYTVYYDGVKAHFIEKKSASEAISAFYFSPVLITETLCTPDINVDVSVSGKIKISIRKDLRQYAMSLYAAVDKPKRIFTFYISAKNDPNKLIDIINIDVIDLVSSGTLDLPFTHDPSKVSIFTRKIFDTYGINK